eukprot:2714142-Pyramimonas_sp.AAC.1
MARTPMRGVLCSEKLLFWHPGMGRSSRQAASLRRRALDSEAAPLDSRRVLERSTASARQDLEGRSGKH